MIVTTTQLALHPENETRLMSVTSNDTPEQTRAIMARIGYQKYAGGTDAPPDYGAWHALFNWIKLNDTKVVIPYAQKLAELIPPVAVRLRRDISTVFSLIETHALLHQATRRRDYNGAVEATLDDYEVVRELVKETLAQGVELTVPVEVRETVRAVQRLLDQRLGLPDETITTNKLKDELGLGISAVRRRSADAIERGFLKNEEPRSGKPYKLVLGNSLPDDKQLLPSVSEVSEAWESEWVETPHP